MTRRAFIREQFDWVDNWTIGLLEKHNEKHWEMIPALSTSMNWQVGHIIISKYFHAVQSIVEDSNNLMQELCGEFSAEDFFSHYFAGSDPTAEWENRPKKDRLLRLFVLLNAKTNNLLDSLTDADLDDATCIANPIAKTKYDALTFCFKHQMWHNGQIAMISRIQQSEK